MTETVTAPAAPAPPANATEAAARLGALSADKIWADRLLSGDGAATREFHQLSEMVANGDQIDMAMAGPLHSLASGVIPDSSLRVMSEGAAMLREKGLSDGTIRQLLSDQPVSVQEQEAAKVWMNEFRTDRERVRKYLEGDAGLGKQVTAAHILINSTIAGEEK